MSDIVVNVLVSNVTRISGSRYALTELSVWRSSLLGALSRSPSSAALPIVAGGRRLPAAQGRLQRIHADYGVVEKNCFISPLSKPGRKDSIRLAAANTRTHFPFSMLFVVTFRSLPWFQEGNIVRILAL